MLSLAGTLLFILAAWLSLPQRTFLEGTPPQGLEVEARP